MRRKKRHEKQEIFQPVPETQRLQVLAPVLFGRLEGLIDYGHPRNAQPQPPPGSITIALRADDQTGKSRPSLPA